MGEWGEFDSEKIKDCYSDKKRKNIGIKINKQTENANITGRINIFWIIHSCCQQ